MISPFLAHTVDQKSRAVIFYSLVRVSEVCSFNLKRSKSVFLFKICIYRLNLNIVTTTEIIV